MEKIKIAFVSHEFDLRKGHGGIAAYLVQITNSLLRQYKEVNIHIICNAYDYSVEYDKRITIHGHLNNPILIDKILLKINPDVVEVQDFLGLCYHSLIKKSIGIDFRETFFCTNHHTNTRECFEWGSNLDFSFSNTSLKEIHSKELVQFILSDYNISPSNFLSRYIKKNYQIPVDTIHLPYNNNLDSGEENQEMFSLENNLSCNFQITLISRFEARKNQKKLVKEFQLFLKNSNSNSRLIMVGNSCDDIYGNDYRFEVFKEINNEYKNKIHFFDFMDLNEQKKIIDITDLVVLSSTFENFPVAMIESIKRGIPVISSKYTGVCDMMGEDLVKTMTFDPFLEGDLATKIEEFYKKDNQEKSIIANKQLNNLNKIITTENTVVKKINQFYCLKEKTKGAFKTLNLHFISNAIKDKDVTDFNIKIKNFLLQNTKEEVFDFIVINKRIQIKQLYNIFKSKKILNNLEKLVIIFSSKVLVPDKELLLYQGFPFSILRVKRNNLQKNKNSSLIDYIWHEINSRIVTSFKVDDDIDEGECCKQTIDAYFRNVRNINFLDLSSKI